MRLFLAGFVRVFRKIVQQIKKPLVFLADEQAIASECLQSPHCCSLCLRGPDDRADPELAAEKRRRLRHNQIGLRSIFEAVIIAFSF